MFAPWCPVLPWVAAVLPASVVPDSSVARMPAHVPCDRDIHCGCRGYPVVLAESLHLTMGCGPWWAWGWTLHGTQCVGVFQ